LPESHAGKCEQAEPKDSGEEVSRISHIVFLTSVRNRIHRLVRGNLQGDLNRKFSCGVLLGMAEEKKGSKDVILWIITVALVALAIFWYMKPR
jgi:hypothetical protein